MRSEPVVTIPAALALVANAVLGLLVKMDVIPSDLVAEIVGIVNGLVVLAGLLLARSKVTPVTQADARVVEAREDARQKTIAALANQPKTARRRAEPPPPAPVARSRKAKRPPTAGK